MKGSLNLLKNRAGNSFVMAIVMLGTTSLLGVGVMEGQKQVRDRVHSVRIKSKMVSLESRLRSLLSQPSAYVGCSNNLTTVTCAVDPGIVDRYRQMRFNGYPCRGENCYIEARGIALEASTRTVSFEIHVTGLGANDRFKPIAVSFNVPPEVLQAQIFDCTQIPGAPGPVFRGFNANGTARCEAIVTECLGETYISGVDRVTGNVICTSFPTNTISCGANQGLNNITWANGQASGSCYGLPNPFSIFSVTNQGVGSGYTPPSSGGYTPPPLPPPPPPTSGAWTHSAWGATSGIPCPGLSLYGWACSPAGFRCDQFHNGIGMETLICQ